VGTFAGGTLAWSNPRVALVSTPDFLDKEWITCDRATNTLYLIYVRFVDYNVTGAVLPDRVEIMRSTDGATTWSAPVVLESSTTDALEMPYVVVGPAGEVYTLCERGLDEVVGIAHDNIADLRFDVLHFAAGSAHLVDSSRDGIADSLTGGVWTAEINAGFGLRTVPATFEAVR